MSPEPQRLTEKHIQVLCSPVNQATVLGGMLSTHPFLARAGTVVSQSVLGSLRNTHCRICMNERHCKNMRNIGFLGAETIIFAGPGDLLGAKQ